MDLADLRIFQAVVEEGGITRAAERLHRVQSNVTTRVRQLEEDLGVDLFVREGKRLHLAPAGRILADYAGRLLELSEEARAAVQDARPRGQFRIGAMESTAAVRLPGPLTDYQRRYPDVQLEITTGNPQQVARAILAGDLDAGFVAEPIADEPFEKVHAFSEELVIISSRDHPDLDAPGARNVLVFEPGCPHRKRLEDWLAERDEVPARLIEIGSYLTMLGCVVVGMGIALVPRSVLDTFPERKRLCVHELPRGSDVAETVLIWRRGADSPNISALVEVLPARRKKRKAA